MPIVVEVVSAEKYAAWVGDQKKKLAALADDPNKVWTQDELKARGEKVFAQNCAACHQATGLGVPGAFPALVGSSIVLGPDADQIRVMLNGVVKNGKPTAMASFKQLSDVELAAVMTYTRNAWANAGKAKDPLVEPADVKAARK
jgi:cytochrome c oxidase subunit 2